MDKRNKTGGPYVGVISLLDPREEYYENFRRNSGLDLEQACGSIHATMIDRLKESGCTVSDGGLLKSRTQTLSTTRELAASDVESIVIHVPTWTFPSFGASAARLAHGRGVSTLVWGTIALSGPLATRGAIEELGFPFGTVIGMPGDPRVERKALAFLRAASAKRSLEGSTLGVFGGRSMGINTGTVDTGQLQRVFGIDVDHTDQLEIARLASEVPDEDVRLHVAYLEEKSAGIDRDEERLTDKSIELAVRGYLATKKIIADNGYDFVGLKCQTELSDWYGNQCLTAAFLNDPYDADGPKEPIVCACEADCNGALTMQILKLISGGKPVLFVDATIVTPDRPQVIACQNCGAGATCFATGSDNPPDNLKCVHIVPNIQGKAGGPALNYYVDSGQRFTCARLSRHEGQYRMRLFEATTAPVDEQLKAMLARWPTIALSLDTDSVLPFLETYASQHLHLVAGSYLDEVAEFCKLFGIEYSGI